MISINGYKEVQFEVKLHELMKTLLESNEVDFKDIVELLKYKFIKYCEPNAEYIRDGNYFSCWQEYYHGSPSIHNIRELDKEELEIYAAINKLRDYVSDL